MARPSKKKRAQHQNRPRSENAVFVAPFVPEAERADAVRLQLEHALTDVLNAARDAVVFGTPKQKDLHIAIFNTAFALHEATVTDGELVRDLERTAIKIAQRHRSAEADGPHLPVPRDDGDLGNDRTARAKWLLLEIVHAALLRAQIATDQDPDVRVDEEGLQRVLVAARNAYKKHVEHERIKLRERKNQKTRKPPPLVLSPPESAALEIVGSMMIVDERFMRLLPRTPRLPVGEDLKIIEDVIRHLQKRNALDVFTVAKSVAYVFGVPWSLWKNFYGHEMKQQWIEQHTKMVSGERTAEENVGAKP